MKCVCGHYRFEHTNLAGMCLVKGCNCKVYRLINELVLWYRKDCCEIYSNVALDSSNHTMDRLKVKVIE